MAINNCPESIKAISKKFDIEHIIPKARLFDDSFSNKTLELRQINIEKADETALDFVERKFGEEGFKEYEARLNMLHDINKKNPEEGISKAKYKKLLMKGSEIGKGFIERDLRDSQYIAKKAKEMLANEFKNQVLFQKISVDTR